jgi:hypothetical protein
MRIARGLVYLSVAYRFVVVLGLSDSVQSMMYCCMYCTDNYECLLL